MDRLAAGAVFHFRPIACGVGVEIAPEASPTHPPRRLRGDFTGDFASWKSILRHLGL